MRRMDGVIMDVLSEQNSKTTFDTKNVIVNISLEGNTDLYVPQTISFGDNCVIGCENSRNMGFLLGYCSKEEAENRKRPIEEEMEKYNDSMNRLWSVPGFKEYFARNHSYVSINDIEAQFGNDAAKFAHGICPITNCYPDLVVIRDVLQLRGAELVARFKIDDKEYTFDIKNSFVDTFNMNDNICSLDWSEDETDRSFSLLNLFINDGAISGGVAEVISERAYYEFQDGNLEDNYLQAMRYTVKLLINRGYLKQYTLTAAEYTDVWNYYTRREDNSVLFTVLNPMYKKDKLLCERINCLWNALYTYDDENGWEDTNFDFGRPFYFLQDENDHTYISFDKAPLGGHKKLRIYGRLDCPSAHRYLVKGQYVQHRVFFRDETTAIAAGYRPCGVCMKEEYKNWKQNNQ